MNRFGGGIFDQHFGGLMGFPGMMDAFGGMNGGGGGMGGFSTSSSMFISGGQGMFLV